MIALIIRILVPLLTEEGAKLLMDYVSKHHKLEVKIVNDPAPKTAANSVFAHLKAAADALAHHTHAEPETVNPFSLSSVGPAASLSSVGPAVSLSSSLSSVAAALSPAVSLPATIEISAAPAVATTPTAPVTQEVPIVATTPTPTAPAKETAGQIFDTVLHDIVLTGILAASIFVKNPKSQQTAATLIQAVQQLLPLLDAQLNGTTL